MTDVTTKTQAWFGSKPISRAQITDWETKRAVKGLRKLGIPRPAGDVDVLRTTLADAKLALGRGAIEKRLEGEIKVSDSVARALARASGGRRRLSQIEVFVPGARAEQLPAWYAERAEVDDEAAFLTATPDHHLFRPVEDPRGQEVWETTGGSPLASRFFFDLDVTGGLVTAADPSYPVQLTGIARLADDTVIGGIRHQFRDENDGARARLTVEFPWLIGPYTPRAHRWHLASEFTAWIEAARDAD